MQSTKSVDYLNVERSQGIQYHLSPIPGSVGGIVNLFGQQNYKELNVKVQ